MRIKKCIAAKPGLFDNTAIEFRGGMNLIYGKNGSGKSILTRALIDVLWGQVHRRQFLKNSLWDNFYLEVHVSNSPRSYRYIRNSDKQFSIRSTEPASREDIFQAVPASGDAAASSESSFPENPFAGEDPELSGLYSKFDFDTMCTAAFVSSPTEPAAESSLSYRFIKNIFLEDDSRFNFLYGNIAGSYGQGEMTRRVHNEILNEILKTEVQLKDIEKKIQIIDLQRSRNEKLAREKIQTGEEILSLEKSISTLREDKTLILAIQADIEKRGRLDDQIARLEAEVRDSHERAELSLVREKELVSQFPQFRNFTDAKKQNLKRLQETYREIRDIHIALDQYHSAKARRLRRMHIIAGAVLLSGLCLLYIAAKRHFPLIPVKFRFNVLIGVFASIGAAVALLYLALLIPFKSRLRDELLRKKSSVIEKLHDIIRENDMELHDFRLEAVYEFLLQYFEEYGGYTEKQLELFILKEGLKSPDHLESIQAQLDSLARERGTLDECILENLGTVMGRFAAARDESKTGEILLEIEKEMILLEEQQDSRMRALQQVKDDIRGNADRTGELNNLTEQKRGLDSKLHGLLTHQRSMQFILELFDRVIERREESQMSRLVRSAKDIFNSITGNQYITIMDNEAVKGFIMDNSRTGELNSALVHTLILSIKIALSEFLAESNISIPLIVDDPFVFMDEKRAAYLKRQLAEISARRQVIVFTQHSHYLDADHRLEL